MRGKAQPSQPRLQTPGQGTLRQGPLGHRLRLARGMDGETHPHVSLIRGQILLVTLETGRDPCAIARQYPLDVRDLQRDARPRLLLSTWRPPLGVWRGAR